MKVSWDEYKVIVGKEIREQKNLIYRGQSDSAWKLTTSIHRTKQLHTHDDFLVYFRTVLPQVQEQIAEQKGTEGF
jgi:hypothetical protein